ncbi:hypothetical protein FO519_004230 [Halicephalobus sp. NKZ332]|nr:hypothetical protein FO519_004230 [Halicephalobus sp. NKZ332]
MLIGQKGDKDDGDVENLVLSWHTFRDFLAVSSYKSSEGGDVGFFTKQGGKSFFKSKKRPAARGTQIAWHSREPVLLVGWDSGKLTLIDPVKGIEEDLLEGDLDEICALSWNSDNNNVLAADNTGKFAQFKVDPLNFSKSKCLHKSNLREEVPVSVIAKSVKV